MNKLAALLDTRFLSFLVFALFAANFAAPTVEFLASMQGQTPEIFSLVRQFVGSIPFITVGIFYYVLFTKILTLVPREALYLSFLEAVLTALVFVIWLARPAFWEILYIPVVVLLYATWLTMISLRGRELRLSGRFEALYIAVNMAFALSFSLHLFKNVDFHHYFGLDLPPFLKWIFTYMPTILVSFTSVMVWTVLLLNLRGLRRLTWHVIVVVLPPIFVTYIRGLRPLFGYVLTSAISWGSSYEFFYPIELSLLMVLLASTAFVSSAILLGPRCMARDHNVIRFSLASAVLAGMSFSPTSIIGVPLSLHLLFLGTKLRTGGLGN